MSLAWILANRVPAKADNRYKLSFEYFAFSYAFRGELGGFLLYCWVSVAIIRNIKILIISGRFLLIL